MSGARIATDTPGKDNDGGPQRRAMEVRQMRRSKGLVPNRGGGQLRRRPPQDRAAYVLTGALRFIDRNGSRVWARLPRSLAALPDALPVRRLSACDPATVT